MYSTWFWRLKQGSGLPAQHLHGHTDHVTMLINVLIIEKSGDLMLLLGGAS
jgi:hypothetical protein